LFRETGTKVAHRLLRRVQTNVLTDIETFDLWELEHRRSQTVKIIIPVAHAFRYCALAKSKSFSPSAATCKNRARSLTLSFIIV
jgi:hypothetical protein